MLFALFSLIFLSSGTDAYVDQMVAIRRHLHQYPELSNREVATQAFLKEQLQAAGFDVIVPLAGTGLKVVYDTGRAGPVLAFRADIDALPVLETTGLPYASQNAGVMHACGHDIHTAILFGTALAIKNDPDLGGVFVFLFQPAEEGAPPGEEGGASVMVAQGALDHPRPLAIFGLHGMAWLPVGKVGFRSGGIMARADRFFVTITGKQTHGSTPNYGIDSIYVASQVVIAAQSIVSRYTDPRDPVVLSFGQFNAGSRFNIISGKATLSGTIRSLNVATGDQVPQLLDRIIDGVARAHGASYVFENETMCPSTQNNAEWTHRSVTNLREAGFDLLEVEPVLAAEDFAYYAETIPGVYFFLGTCDQESCPNIHESGYAPSEKTLKLGADLFYRLARTLR